MKNILFVIYCFIFLVTCTKEETTSRPYPRVETGEVSDIKSTGATFHGEVTFASSEIADHGFVWSENTTPTLENSDQLSLGSTSGRGKFDTQINRDLATGVKYYVRAYAKSDKYLVYGEVVTFISLGSKAPQIRDFVPKVASVGDTIIIRGSNFSYRKDIDIIKFASTTALVAFATDSLVKCVVPSDLMTISSELSISIYGNKGVASNLFTLTPPQIISVDKSTVGICDTITLTTIHLPIDLSKALVFFNDKSTTPISLVRNKLKVKVPFIPPATTSISLKLTYGGQENIFSAPLNFIQPKVLSISPASAGFLDTLTVSMANIPSCGFDVQIGNTSVKPVELTSSYFKVVTPSTLTSSSIDLKTFVNANLLFESTVPRALTINSFTPSSGTFGDVITINGRGFHPDPSQNIVCFNCNVAYLNQYNGTKAQIISSSPHQLKVKIPNEYISPPNGLGNIGVFTLPATPAYLYASSSQNFYLNPPIINSISPGAITNGTTITVSGQNFDPDLAFNSLILDYTNQSINIVSATPTQLVFQTTNNAIDLSVFNYSNRYMSSNYQSTLTLHVAGQSVTTAPVQVNYQGPWTKRAEFPGMGRSGGLSFSFDKKIYFGLGKAVGTLAPLSDFWEYDVSLDQWTRLSDFPGPARYSAATWMFNNYGYLGFGTGASGYLPDVWRFNPTNNSWTQLPDLPIPNVMNGASIVYNNQPFISAGGLKNFWKFNANETWTQLNDLPYYMAEMAATQSTMYAMMQTGSGSSTLAFFNYDPNADLWSPSSIPFNYTDQYLSAYGKAYVQSPGYGGVFGVLNENTLTWDAIYSPGIFNYTYFTTGFYAGQKLFFVAYSITDQTTSMYQFDPSLYPPQ